MVHIVLAGGGTAGHVNPLLAVAHTIKRLDSNVSLSVIGTSQGLESELVPAAGYEIDCIEKLPFPRRPNSKAVRFPQQWIHQQHLVRSILIRRKADVVVGFGGYTAAPVYAVAHRMHIPIIIHEQNARSGLANKLGAHWADFIGTVYENTGLKSRKTGVIQKIGLPLRPAIAELSDARENNLLGVRSACARYLGINAKKPTIVVTGGSLGAASLNSAISQAAKELTDYVQVIHLTGKGKTQSVIDTVQRCLPTENVRTLPNITTHISYKELIREDELQKKQVISQALYMIAPYLERVDFAFACADLVVCRSGASTVAELTALGIPAVYVPLPIGNGEQRFNAMPIVDSHGAVMVSDHDFTKEYVQENICTMLANPQYLRSMSSNAFACGVRNAADVMARKVLDIAYANQKNI